MGPDIENLYTRFGPMMLRRGCQFLRNEEEAMDAVQECFARLCLKGTPGPEFGLKHPSSFLFTMVTHECLNRLRSHHQSRREDAEDLLLSIASLEDIEERSTASRILDKLFGRDETQTRVLAVMHFVDGMTLEETARTGGLSVSGLRKRFRILSERLHSLVKENV